MSLKITDKDSPRPTLLTTLPLYLRDLKDKDGKLYDLSGASKFYATIKDALSDADNAAAVSINSTTNPTQFVITYANTGNLDIIFSTTNTDLTADIPYYVDVKAIWANGNAVVLVEDTLIFQTPSTKAVS
jgi:hypothetical protein